MILGFKVKSAGQKVQRGFIIHGTLFLFIQRTIPLPIKGKALKYGRMAVVC